MALVSDNSLLLRVVDGQVDLWAAQVGQLDQLLDDSALPFAKSDRPLVIVGDS